MTLNEFLKYVETRKPLKGDEIHQFMNKMSDEARRMTFELNGSYHAPEEIRELLKARVDKITVVVAPFAVFLVEFAARLLADGRVVKRHTAALANELPRRAEKRIYRHVKQLGKELQRLSIRHGIARLPA